MNQQRPNIINSNNLRNSTSILASGSGPQIVGSGVPNTIPPPLPPRRSVSSYQNYNNYPGLGNYFGNYGMGSSLNYSGYGGYGGYGSYGMHNGRYGSYGYSPYGNGQFGGPSGDVENRFVQYAEESTRPAFQSIETMVHTFSSVTMMLESTFFAMTSSFRAILGVAENMGRLRLIFGQFLNSFALVRILKWLYWKTRHLLGLRGHDPSSESAWQQTVSEVMNETVSQNGPSTWPIFMFLSLLVAAPYMVHKLVNNVKSTSIEENNPKDWVKYNEPIYIATTLYDFVAASNDELSFKTGQKLWLAPQSLHPKALPGWWKATDSINVGLIPSSYVTIVGQLKKKTETNSNINQSIPEENSTNSKVTSKETNFKYNLEEAYKERSSNKECQDTNDEIF
ncbi:probable peroxisomal membrane protein PEX13 [Leptopilina heterotoma]|uniref:probable peroxisomal membrane protein PEX13 n=1 Tax=Leptopilina heterotoma TaxID=63436 RepID=UPI001CA9285E|nr:probable peroxisomal membrane protein PEX13 [Leptopilina heterotoma]